MRPRNGNGAMQHVADVSKREERRRAKASKVRSQSIDRACPKSTAVAAAAAGTQAGGIGRGRRVSGEMRPKCVAGAGRCRAKIQPKSSRGDTKRAVRSWKQQQTATAAGGSGKSVGPSRPERSNHQCSSNQSPAASGRHRERIRARLRSSEQADPDAIHRASSVPSVVSWSVEFPPGPRSKFIRPRTMVEHRANTTSCEAEAIQPRQRSKTSVEIVAKGRRGPGWQAHATVDRSCPYPTGDSQSRERGIAVPRRRALAEAYESDPQSIKGASGRSRRLIEKVEIEQRKGKGKRKREQRRRGSVAPFSA